MPNANYTVKYEQSIFDVAVNLYGSVDSAIKLLLENDNITDVNTDLEGITIVYDVDYKATKLVPLITKKPPVINLAQIYKPTDFQTIFDVALMLDGNLSGVVNLVHNSTLQNINTDVKFNDSFNFTKKSSGILDWIEKTGQVFQTKTPLEGNAGREHSTAFDLLSHT